jgi:phosphoribosylformylglycinamidine synthase
VTSLVRALVAEVLGGTGGLLSGVHDVSGGGLAVALAEMAVGAGLGCVVTCSGGAAELFSELPSRVLVATAQPAEVLARADAVGVPATVLGRAGGDRLRLGDLIDLPVGAVAARSASALPEALGEAAGEAP